MKVGLLGLGQMGRAVARRLIAAGYQLKLYNRTASKLVALVREGAAHDDAFHSVISGPEGIAAGIGAGAILIDMSTLTAGAIAAAAEAVGRQGAKMLHAPILGGPKNVFIGSATITVGGDEADFRRARPLLEAVSQPVFHVGPLEKGTHMKMALNIQKGGTRSRIDPFDASACRRRCNRRLRRKDARRRRGGSAIFS